MRKTTHLSDEPKKTSAVISEDVWGIFINRHVFLKKVNQQTSCDVMR